MIEIQSPTRPGAGASAWREDPGAEARAQLVEVCKETWLKLAGDHGGHAAAFAAVAKQVGQLVEKVALLEEDGARQAPTGAVQGELPGPQAADEAGCLIRNTTSGVVHKVALGGMQWAPQAWRTVCGWRYGVRPHEPRVPMPESRKHTCERCFPEAWASGSGSSSSESSDGEGALGEGGQCGE